MVRESGPLSTISPKLYPDFELHDLYHFLTVNSPNWYFPSLMTGRETVSRFNVLSCLCVYRKFGFYIIINKGWATVSELECTVVIMKWFLHHLFISHFILFYF